MIRDLRYVLVWIDLTMTEWLKIGPVSIPNSCGHDTGGFLCDSNMFETPHHCPQSRVEQKVVSRLIRNSVFPSGSWLNNKKASESERSGIIRLDLHYSHPWRPESSKWRTCFFQEERWKAGLIFNGVCEMKLSEMLLFNEISLKFNEEKGSS